MFVIASQRIQKHVYVSPVVNIGFIELQLGSIALISLAKNREYT